MVLYMIHIHIYYHEGGHLLAEPLLSCFGKDGWIKRLQPDAFDIYTLVRFVLSGLV